MKKIIIIEGQRFEVDATADNEAIRQQLATQYPMAATATIETRTETIDGVERQIVEFVKKVGTKG